MSSTMILVMHVLYCGAAVIAAKDQKRPVQDGSPQMKLIPDLNQLPPVEEEEQYGKGVLSHPSTI